MFQLTMVCGCNNSNLSKDFRMELQDPFSSTFPKKEKKSAGRGFNIIRRISKKLGGSSLTPRMWDFCKFISESKLIDSPLRNNPFTWSNM